jgi:hypothetical protein
MLSIYNRLLTIKIAKVNALIYDVVEVLKLFKQSGDKAVRIECNLLLNELKKLPTVKGVEYRKLDTFYIEEKLEEIRKRISRINIPDKRNIERIAEKQCRVYRHKEEIIQISEYLILPPTCYNCVDYFNDSHNWEAESLRRELEQAGEELEEEKEKDLDITVIVIK